jgi:conjugative transposon TraK protein
MLKQYQNLESAFRHIRLFSLFFLLVNVAVSLYAIYKSDEAQRLSRNKVYLIANGKLLSAVAVDRAENMPVEIRDHVKMFHFYFFSLEPDDKVIKAHLTKALYLADVTAKTEYDDLNETGYYSNLISGNVSQQVEEPDSIQVDMNQIPYYFRYSGKIRIVRATTITIRVLVAEGYIRSTTMSDNNPHGLLIERWKILDNHDLSTQKR